MTVSSIQALPQRIKGFKSAWLHHALCVVLSLIFLTAAIAKTTGFRELEATLVASRIVPVLAVQFAATMLLVLEYLFALLLLIPKTRRIALNLAVGLVSLFLAYTIWRWMQGIGVPCNCFSVLLKLEPWQSILLNLVLLTLAGFLLGKHSTTISTHHSR